MDDDQIKSLLLQDRKVQAIKLVIQQTGWGLRKAKDYVDALQQSLLPRSANISNVPDEPNEFMVKKACQLITQGRKIEAIQLLHHTTEMTLKEAKDYIDRLALEQSLRDV